jgi:hypothetical protein
MPSVPALAAAVRGLARAQEPVGPVRVPGLARARALAGEAPVRAPVSVPASVVRVPAARRA